MVSPTDTAIVFNPFQAGRDVDPYPLYDRMREDAPVYHDPVHELFAVTRFDDVQAISRDWTRFSNAQGVDIDQTGNTFGANFLDSDPPRHRLIRTLLQHRFSPKSVREALESVVRQQVSKLVSAVVEKGEADLAEELAWPLPIAISSHLLGFPDSDREFLSAASRRFMEREYDQPLLPADAQRAAEELDAYMVHMAADRRRAPGDDLMSLLAAAEVDGEALPEPELVAHAWLLFDAGVHTTACLLSSAFVLFDEHPDQRRWLIEHPEHVPQAVEELLRYESPIQSLIRTTTADIELHGVDIPTGATVALLYGAANRDPRKWRHPARLNFARKPLRNLAFGEGIHHCLGAPIVRLEAATLLDVLLPHIRDFDLTGPPPRLRSHFIRGYVRVPAVFA
jgi:cytochrome P450